MFKFIKKIFITIITFFSSLLNVNPLECIAMKNQECKVRSGIVDAVFYLFSIMVIVKMLVIYM